MYADFNRFENHFDAHNNPNEREGFHGGRCHQGPDRMPNAFAGSDGDFRPMLHGFDDPGMPPHAFKCHNGNSGRMLHSFGNPDDAHRPIPYHFDGPDGGHRCMPYRFDGPDGSPRNMPRDFGGPGMPPFGGPGFPPHDMGPGGPGAPGGHGMGPRRMRPRGPRHPDPEFLKRRVEEADLAELIDMAGRMMHRRPQGGPAQGQALVLSILLGREVLSQRELQQILGIQPGSLSELVSKLEAKGYLTREKAEDRRGNLLRITDAGRVAAAETADTPQDDPFSPLTDEQQDQLSAMLRTLLSRWVEQLDAPSQPRQEQRPVEV